jgi:hypothetical protein
LLIAVPVLLAGPVLMAAPVLLATPVSEGPLEPQPAPIAAITAKAASVLSFLFIALSSDRG